jgi:cytochrome c556
MHTRKHLASVRLAFWNATALFAIATGVQAADSSLNPAVAALHGTVAKNISHARDWLDGNDFKSLNQAAGGMQILIEVLQAHSDDAPWQAATGKMLSNVAEVQKAAGSSNAADAKAALASLEKSAEAAAALQPAGKPKAISRNPPVRPLMLTLDGIYADAKIALLTGRVADAKKGAYTLSELGRVLSNSQSGNRKGRETWPEMSASFTAAALAAAQSPAEDAASVKKLLHVMSQRCEACHETRSR